MPDSQPQPLNKSFPSDDPLLKNSWLQRIDAAVSPFFAVTLLFVMLCPGGLRFSVFAQTDWPNVGNDKGAMRYSPLTQINRDNVRNLKPVWAYRTGDAGPDNETTIQCTPIVVDGVLYLTTAKARIVALNAATGKEIWKYDPFAGAPPTGIYPAGGGVNRGVAYWSEKGSRKSARILTATADGRLISLSAATGKPDPAFGKNGIVDLRAGIDLDLADHTYGSTAAPAVFENLIIVPISLNDAHQMIAPGDVRAFDVQTGKEVWRFHTVPRPGNSGHNTWEGDGWKNRSGTNPWSGFTIDTKRALIFMGTGSPTFDFYGGDRLGDNLFANSTIALDARTGKRRWHFQTVHHDLWDYDLPYPPLLVTVNHRNRMIDAAAQITKTGMLFLFDRLTGKPLFGVEERRVPASDIPGERTSPTQPFPLKPAPFARQTFTEADVTDISPESRAFIQEKIKTLRGGNIFLPPSFQGTLVMPGFLGGATWSGASFDPATGLLYVNANSLANHLTLAPVENKPFPYRQMGYIQFRDQYGYPANKPPWGTLTAIDLNKGEIIWQVPLGEYPELTARGIPQTGTENLGGSIVTAGGLVFIAATRDEKIRAFDKSSGRVLWEAKLSAGGYAAPCTYTVNGRQYITIAAGGGGKWKTKSGDEFTAFALP